MARPEDAPLATTPSNSPRAELHFSPFSRDSADGPMPTSRLFIPASSRFPEPHATQRNRRALAN